MPGLKRSPGMAETDAHDSAHQMGYNGFADVSRSSRRISSEGNAKYRISSIDTTSPYPYMLSSLPTSWPESPSDDGSASSDSLVHRGFENLVPRKNIRMLSFEDSGMPPTPPTMSNSDVAGAMQERSAERAPVFADGVRNALEAQASGFSATPVNAISPPTPDPSPPATSDALPANQKAKAQFLQPWVSESKSLRSIRDNASSRAESFKTAREDQQSITQAGLSQVHLPVNDTLPEHWLDTTRELADADLGLGNVTVRETPKADSMPPLKVQKRARRTSKHESPPQTAEGDGSDWEKHISYVSGPHELDDHDTPNGDIQPAANGLGLSGAGVSQGLERSAEDVNNMVYKRIQEENMKRHSAVSAKSGAITVGIIVPPSESTPRTLKRQTKCLSLRGDDGFSSHRGSVDGDAGMLTNKKIRLPGRPRKLDDSPVFESSIRQVSSPARLGPDASNMTALTYASLQNSPSARPTAKFAPEKSHPLRHTSPSDRLSNNPSVRRTSLHGSPTSPSRWLDGVEDAEPPVVSPPVSPPRVRNNDRVGHNVGVKRDSGEGARPSRVLEKASNTVRDVAPLVTTEVEAYSPTSGRLRHFSRGERLENNEHVRRTSLGSSRDVGKEGETGKRSPSWDRPVIPNVPFSDHSAVLSSPRKSLDARHLHPITTPMSISQFSEREEVEVCEASGVRIYPHNNNSLLVVQNGSRPVSKDDNTPDQPEIEERLRDLGKPIFAAQIDPPTPIIGISNPDANVDSPLTNPRLAPEPPVIKFIPPTPNEELERQLEDQEAGTLRAEVNLPVRRLSLLQKARRYSDSLFIRTGSLRRPRQYEPEPQQRAVHLSPLWRPQGFWDDFDSDEEYYDDFEPAGTLPKGGDTSDVPDSVENRKAGIFPRVMSKRLPGFRGQGGFLVGNSLGIDRHGTNSRRHYVSTRSKTLSKRESQEVLRSLAQKNATGDPQASLSKAGDGGRAFIVPFSGGRRAQWVGTKRLRARMSRLRAKREEAERERRRESLRNKIGMRVYHDTGR